MHYYHINVRNTNYIILLTTGMHVKLKAANAKDKLVYT